MRFGVFPPWATSESGCIFFAWLAAGTINFPSLSTALLLRKFIQFSAFKFLIVGRWVGLQKLFTQISITINSRFIGDWGVAKRGKNKIQINIFSRTKNNLPPKEIFPKPKAPQQFVLLNLSSLI